MCCRHVCIAGTFLFALAVRFQADIFRWDNGQLIPGTEGIMPGPGVQLLIAISNSRSFRK